jgi:hypothetical protein
VPADPAFCTLKTPEFGVPLRLELWQLALCWFLLSEMGILDSAGRAVNPVDVAVANLH